MLLFALRRKNKRIYSGFTLIELLVVLGVLAILFSIVLIAINPLEQINKANDVSRLGQIKDFSSAINYHYAMDKSLPWSQTGDCRNELKSETTLNQVPACIKDIVENSAQIQASLISADSSKDIYVTECNSGIALCFSPKSRLFNQSSVVKYAKNGVLNPGCSGTSGNSNDCYVCTFSTNEAEECFQALNPNGSLAVVPTPIPHQTLPIPSRHSKNSCNDAVSGTVSCMVEVVTSSIGTPLSSIGLPGGFGPDQLHTAYNLPCSPGGPVQVRCSTPATFGPQIVAIVDAFGAPTVEQDLAVYNQIYNLPSCTSANGCLTIVNQNGATSPLPPTDSNWALETSLDVEIAHAVCQTCKILLIESNTNYFSDIAAAVNRAALMGATSISNSYGANEWSGETAYDSSYDHPGIFVTAASGDWGYGSFYPAASKNVIAVGGTTLSLLNDNTYSSEKVWAGAGSGCSGFQAANSFQTGLPNWASTGCGSNKGISDVSAVADPNTGVSVYDTTAYFGSSGWWILGGTSVSSPVMAATLALIGSVPPGTYGTNYVYANQAKFRDVVSGSNGSCGGRSICMAGVGYDGPTGLGSPNLLSAQILPTPTVSLTPTPMPSSNYLIGYCGIRDPNVLPPGIRAKDGLTAPDLATGYARVQKISNFPSDYSNASFLNMRDQLLPLCNSSVNQALKTSYCSQNTNSAYFEFIAYKPDGSYFGNGNNPIDLTLNTCPMPTPIPTISMVPGQSQVWMGNYVNSVIPRYSSDGTSGGSPINGNNLNLIRGMAVVGKKVWVENDNSHYISWFNFDGTPAGGFSILSARCQGGGMAVVGSQVWLVCNNNTNIIRFNTDGTSAGGALTGNGLNHPLGIAVVGQQVWVTNMWGKDISLFNFDGTVAGLPIYPPNMNDPSGIAVVGSQVWVVSESPSVIIRLNFDGTQADTPITKNVQQYPFGIAVVGDQVWVTNTGVSGYNVSRFDFVGNALGNPLTGNGQADSCFIVDVPYF